MNSLENKDTKIEKIRENKDEEEEIYLFDNKRKTLTVNQLGFLFLWCPEQESNLHTSRYTHLKRTRLPIPPSGLGDGAQDKSRTCMP